MGYIAAFVVGAIIGTTGGFIGGKGVEGAGKIVQWGVIGTAGFLAYQHFKR